MRALVLLVLLVLLACNAHAVSQSRTESSDCSCHTRARKGYTNPSCECTAQPQQHAFVNSLVDFFGVGAEVVNRITDSEECHCSSEPAEGFHQEECTCGAIQVECPTHSDGHPHCKPVKGYYGVITWNSQEEKYFILDTETNAFVENVTVRECPTNSDKWPSCQCVAGYTGSYTWNSTTLNWDGGCSEAECPTNGGKKPNCACPEGYKETETVEFNLDSQTWSGQCQRVSCPANSLKDTFPACSCKTGFTGLVTFDDDTDTFHDGCKLADCPGNSTHVGGGGIDAAVCECNKGFYDADSDPLVFSNTAGWTGSCEKRECRPFATGHPDCTCVEGYLGGTLSWSTESHDFTSTCQVATCPDHGDADSCACLHGYVSAPGQPTWDTVKGWTHTCTANDPPCPTGSSSTTPTQCPCNLPGYTGDPTWNGSSWSDCVLVDPPEFASRVQLEDGSFAASCNIGYVGKVTWNVDRWVGSCTPAECPSHAICNPPNAQCVTGFARDVVWNETSTSWSSSCTLVDCPSNSKGEPNCKCLDGFAGGNSTNFLIFVSEGVDSHYECTGPDCTEHCKKIDCPAHSVRNADHSCTCERGYAGTLTWNAVRKGYDGSCQPQPCPGNSTVAEGGNCICKKGFLPSTEYDFVDGSWRGSCDVQSCGPHTTGWPNCVCLPGAHFLDSVPISWDDATGFKSSCVLADCPDNAGPKGTSARSCACGTGFATTVDGEIIPSAHVWDNDHWKHKCLRIPCTSGADDSQHPSCQCLSGYSGTTSWSPSEGRWSACSEVPCKSGSDLVRAQTAKDTAQCTCKMGFAGNVQWDSDSQTWSGECTEAKCDASAVCTSTGGACAHGYKGTVAWESPNWSIDCEFVPCPANSTGNPCKCKNGYAGGELPFDGTEYGRCTYVACPPNSDRIGTEGVCQCREFYNGTIQWGTNAYNGECALASCPEHAGQAPNCACEYGTKPSADFGWSNEKQMWVGRCVPATCPENCRSKTMNCTCDVGFVGTVSWNPETHEFSGTCEDAECPSHASGPGCECDSGYSGMPYSWNGTHWLHTCKPLSCADDSLQVDLVEGGYTCACKVPFKGTPQWTGTQWTADCQEVSCPVFSSVKPGDPTRCICQDGFAGTISWSSQLQGYDSICVPIDCPPSSLPDPKSGTCVCKPGYTGEVVWEGNDWNSGCAQGNCRPNSNFDEAKGLCVCDEGYKGKLVWNEAKDDYEGSCTKVVCSERVPNSSGVPHPTCACDQGFKETQAIQWDPASQDYSGTCEKEECPSFASHHPNCQCIEKYKNVANNPVEWNDNTDSWDGACEAVPCLDHHGTNPPNCKCDTGYAPRGVAIQGDHYVGSCESVPCPNNHGESPHCACAVGYSGSVTWNSTSYSWKNQCIMENCPDHAGERLVCDCDVGYSGHPSWDTQSQSWKHNCSRVDCPTNADGLPCECVSGYSGEVTWQEDQTYSGSCSIIPCPNFSRRRATKTTAGAAIAGCDCYVGFAGGYDWVGSQYEGSCMKVDCPANGDCGKDASSLSTVFGCQEGYQGSVSWIGDRWLDRCVFEPCPDLSDGHPDCKCVPGTAGQVRGGGSFDVKQSHYTYEYHANCQVVPCPDDMMVRTNTTEGFPVCTCPAGFSGKASWNSDTQAFSGATECAEVACPDQLMSKFSSNTLCNCPVNYAGSARWISLTQTYESNVCQLTECPLGAVCDTNSAPRDCKPYYIGQYKWDFTNQNWDASCVLAQCPDNSRKLVDDEGDPAGCECNVGFQPSNVWATDTQSYTGCNLDAECPEHTTDDRNAITKGVLCSCAPGYVGSRLWDGDLAQYNHSCSQMACPTGSDRRSDGLCHCSIGWIGGISWSPDLQTYTGQCSVAPCGGEGVDCTNSNQTDKNPIPDQLPCTPGYYSRTLWVPANEETGQEGEWKNKCEYVQCPVNAVRLNISDCACKWGFSGSVVWDPTLQQFNASCAAVACPVGTLDQGDGHCVCPRGTESGSSSFSVEDVWQHDCGAMAPCQGNSTAIGDTEACKCNKGYSGTLSLSYSVEVTDSNETSSVAMSTSRHGFCKEVSCPVNSHPGSFPDCICASGYTGKVDWNTETSTWYSTCVVAECPANTGDSPSCRAKKGYLGQLTWNFDSQQYDGEISLADCPSNAQAGVAKDVPTCMCRRGYNGTQTFVHGTGWTHTCSLTPCPKFGVKVDADASTFITFQKSIGCHHPQTRANLGYISKAATALKIPEENCQTTDCVSRGEKACDAIIAAGGECWGFGVHADWGVQMYTSDAVNTDLCDPDTGLEANPEWTTYRRRQLKGDCQCEPGYKGSFVWTGTEYQGSCVSAACPDNADCSTTVDCHPGYRGSADITWDYDSEKWNGQCSPVACLENALEGSFPSCRCAAGFSGQFSWNDTIERWDGQCSVVNCPANSDGTSPHCKCGRGFVRSDNAADSPVIWDFDAQHWAQTCKEVACPGHSDKVSNGDCECRIGYRGIPVFEFDTATYVITESPNVNQCEKVACPEKSHEIDGIGSFGCKCDLGYRGEMNWNPAKYQWGSCEEVACPAHSAGHPHCACTTGYGGELTWTGAQFSGTCKELLTTPQWGIVSSSSVNAAVCTALKSSQSTATAGSGRIGFNFAQDSSVSILRCDIKLDYDFSKIRGSITVDPVDNSTVLNNYEVTLWNSTFLSSETEFVAFGTPYSIVDAGMAGGVAAQEYTSASTITIPESTVTQTDTVRIEIAQKSGVQLALSLNIETYNMPMEIVRTRRSVSA